MRLRKNGALFGVLLIIIGLYALLSSGGIEFGYLLHLAIGAALLLLYYGKRKTWALLLGVVFTWLGTYMALRSYGFSWLSMPCVLFFFIPGTVFMSLFLTKNKQGLLIPASVLLWCGFGITIKGLPFIPAEASILTLCLGAALVTIYLLGNDRISRNYLYVGVIVALFGLYSFIEPFTIVTIGKLGWLAVALLCAILMFNARKHKKNKTDNSPNNGDEPYE